MKRILLIALLVLVGHVAHAQTFGVHLGVRLEGVPELHGIFAGSPLIPALGLHVGAESVGSDLGWGVRGSLTSLVLLYWHGSVDAYVMYRLPDATTLYGGLGAGYSLTLFGFEAADVHALLGVRLAGGFFLEATPGLGFANVCREYDFSPSMTGRSVCIRSENVQRLAVGFALGWAWTLP